VVCTYFYTESLNIYISYISVQKHTSTYISVYTLIYVCTPTQSNWVPSLVLKLPPFFLLRMNFHLLALQVFLSFASKYFSPSPPSISLLPLQVFLSLVSTGGSFQLFITVVLCFCFILVAPCLTPRPHFHHPDSWQSLPRLELRCLLSS